MIAYLVVDVYHAYKIWCPCGAVKEKAGKKGNSSNSLWTNDFPENKTAIVFADDSRPFSSFPGWSMGKGGVGETSAMGRSRWIRPRKGASPAGHIPYRFLTRRGEGEEERAEETFRTTVGAHPLSRTHCGIFLQNFSAKIIDSSPGEAKIRLDSW